MRNTAKIGSLLLVFLAGYSGGVAYAQTADEPPPKLRPYTDGPLTTRDYAAAPPASTLGLDAYTTTDLCYDYAYRSQFRPGHASAYLTELTITAVVDPAKSWNKRPFDVRLLDHEQGHFDLTYAMELQTRLHFAKLQGENRLIGTGRTEQAAVLDLQQDIERELQLSFDALLGQQKEYDRVTRHGLNREEQARQRQQQVKRIQQLAAELQKLND
jgi:hypothetical protein